MAKITDVIEGLTILAKYTKPNSHDIAAEHDIIYAGPTEENVIENDDGECVGSVVAEVDAARLRELGWHIDFETDSWGKFV